MKLEIQQVDSGAKNSFTFVAKCDGVVCGNIQAYKLGRKVGGRVVYTVASVSVDKQHQRKGIGTKLYEAAHAEACARRSRLASTERLRDAHSNEFWAKQAAKGRAAVFRPPPGRPATMRDFYRQYVVTSCDTRDLSGLRRRR